MSEQQSDNPEVCCGEFATCKRPCTPRGTTEAMQRVERMLRTASVSLPPEFAKVINDNFWKLVQGQPESMVTAPLPECGSITTNEAMKYLDEGFDIKVLNPERGTYWRCSYCGRDDSEQHDEGCLIRRLVRHAQATPRSATQESKCKCLPPMLLQEQFYKGELK